MPQVVINTNKTSLIALDRLRTNTNLVNQAADQLASGRKINGPNDDAAGYSIARLLDQQIITKQRALQNAQDGISLLEVADGSLGQINDGLQRVRELTLALANDTNSQNERDSYAKEIRSVLEDIDRIGKATSFNSVNLLDGTATNAKVQIGFGTDPSANTVDITSALGQVDNTTLGVVLGTNAGAFITSLDDVFNGTTTQLSSNSRALQFISDLDGALSRLSVQRGSVGGFTNQLSRLVEFIGTATVNEQQAQSRIQDANIAQVSAQYSQAQVIQQAAISILGQSNSSNENVLSLLQR
jgi:flagellin